jgi:L-amino acid N-acyltransferase
MNIITRPATIDDLSSINDIYNYYVYNSTCTFQTEPDTLENRIEWLKDHDDSYPVIVAEAGGDIIGWASLSQFKKRQAYRPTVENSVYIRYDKTGNGIGSMMMKEIIQQANEIGYHSIIAGISGDQDISIRLHEKFGFQKVAHLKAVGYKFNKWLDVLYYQLML